MVQPRKASVRNLYLTGSLGMMTDVPPTHPLHHLTDQDHLSRWVHEQDSEAFQNLLTRHADAVLACCHRILGPGQNADDAFQLTFVSLAKHAGRITPQALPAWLHRTATRAALRLRQSNAKRTDRERAHHKHTQSAQDAQTEVLAQEQRKLIDAAIDTLPRINRIIILRHFISGESLAQIAADLGLTPDSVRMRRNRALARLKHRLIRHGLTVTSMAVLLMPTKGASVYASERLLSATMKRVSSRKPGGLHSSTPHAGTVLLTTTALAGLGVLLYASLRQTPELHIQTAASAHKQLVNSTKHINTSIPKQMSIKPEDTGTKASCVLSPEKIANLRLKLYYKNTSIETVVDHMKKVMAVPITIHCETKHSHPITLMLENVTLRNAMEFIALSCDLAYTRDEDGAYHFWENHKKTRSFKKQRRNFLRMDLANGYTTHHEVSILTLRQSFRDRFGLYPAHDGHDHDDRTMDVRVYPQDEHEDGSYSWCRAEHLFDALSFAYRTQPFDRLRTAIDLDLEDAPLTTVLDRLTQACGLPIILHLNRPPPRLSINVEHIAVDQILNLIAKHLGLVWCERADGGVALFEPLIPRTDRPEVQVEVVQPEPDMHRINVNWQEADYRDVLTDLAKQLGLVVHCNHPAGMRNPPPVLLRLQDYEAKHIVTILNSLPGLHVDIRDGVLFATISEDKRNDLTEHVPAGIQ